MIQLLRRQHACTPVRGHAPVASVKRCLPLPPLTISALRLNADFYRLAENLSRLCRLVCLRQLRETFDNSCLHVTRTPFRRHRLPSTTLPVWLLGFPGVFDLARGHQVSKPI